MRVPSFCIHSQGLSIVQDLLQVAVVWEAAPDISSRTSCHSSGQTVETKKHTCNVMVNIDN